LAVLDILYRGEVGLAPLELQDCTVFSDPRYETPEVPAGLREAADAKRYISPDVVEWRQLGKMAVQTLDWKAKAKTAKTRDKDKTKKKIALLGDDDEEEGERNAVMSEATSNRDRMVTGKAKVNKEKKLEKAFVKMQLARKVERFALKEHPSLSSGNNRGKRYK
jgi:hypothetical protein